MSMYLDGEKPFELRKSNPIKKRHSGEIIGPYKLIKLAGEGPNADSAYWIAECTQCGDILTIDVRRVTNLRALKNCKKCRPTKRRSSTPTSLDHEC
jgi:hypothetical protein